MKNFHTKLNTLFISTNIHLIKNINLNNNVKIILTHNNIYDLENNKKLLKNIYIYPVNNIMITNNDTKIFTQIITNKIKNADLMIVDTPQPKFAKPIENIKISEWNAHFLREIMHILYLINIYIQNKIIIFIIYREKKIKNPFFIINRCINKIILEITTHLNKNIKINIISTENINTEYKTKIYPQKKQKKLKNIELIKKAIELIKKHNLNKKIIII